jgi:hypothetical protein
MMGVGGIESFSAAKTPSMASYADIHVHNSGYKTFYSTCFNFNFIREDAKLKFVGAVSLRRRE